MPYRQGFLGELPLGGYTHYDVRVFIRFGTHPDEANLFE
jgi:hypothetical protein